MTPIDHGRALEPPNAVIDRALLGINSWMYQPTCRALVLAWLLGAAACGGNEEPSHGWPDDVGAGGRSSSGAPGNQGSAPSAGKPGAGGANLGGAASVAGASSSAGGPAQGGSGGSSPGAAGMPGAGAPAAGAQSEYWIATNGADSNPGTEAAPLKTLQAAVHKAKPGVKLWLQPGTYPSTTTVDILYQYSGTAAAPVVLQAAPGARPVLDFTGQTVGNDDARGLNLFANYWHIKGIELKKSGDNCIGISGSYNVIEDVVAHECGDTGIQITAPSSQATDDTRAAHNQILNCDSWGNLDSATGGENADGFAAKLRIGPGNVFRGCRAWNNADDGWDLFAADDVVVIDQSWAFSNGKPLGGSNPQGDGNGFKLGGEPNGEGQGGAVHLATASFAFENKSCGFVRNNNPENPKLTGCGAKDNKTAYCSLSVSSEASMSMTAAAARSAARAADGSLPAMN